MMMARNNDGQSGDRPVARLILLKRPQHVVAQTAGGHHAGDGHHGQCHQGGLIDPRHDRRQGHRNLNFRQYLQR